MSTYDKYSKQKKNSQNKTNVSKGAQYKQNAEKKYVAKLSDGQKKFYSGNRVADAMSRQSYYNSKGSDPKYAASDALKANKERFFTGGRAHWKIGEDVKDAKGNKTGEYRRYDEKKIKDNYKTRYIKNAGTYNSTANVYGKKTKGVKMLSDNQIEEYNRNKEVPWGSGTRDLSPINKVDPNGKTKSPIKEGFKQASKVKSPLGKLGAVAGGVAGGAFNGFMEVADALNTLNYGAHGAMSGFVEGFNNDGKLNKGEIKKALRNAGDKGKKGLNAGVSTSNEGRYGWYDTLKAFSDDKHEREVRDGKIFSDADEKKRLAKLSALGLGLDVGGALLTANAGKLASKGAQLVAKGNKVGGSALKTLGNASKFADLGIDLPMADLLRGSGIKLNGLKPIATSADEVSGIVDNALGGINKVGASNAINEHLVNSTVNKINKTRGVRTPSHGVKLAGFEVMKPQTVQSIADSRLNAPGRALNSVLDKIQAGRRASGYNPVKMSDMAVANINKANKAGKLTDMLDTPRALDEVAQTVDMDSPRVKMALQMLANGSSDAMETPDVIRRNAIQDMVNRNNALRANTKPAKDSQILDAMTGKNYLYNSVKEDYSNINKYKNAIANENMLDEKAIRTNNFVNNEIPKLNEGRVFNANNVEANNLVSPVLQDKPALQKVLGNTKNNQFDKLMSLQGDDLLNAVDNLDDKTSDAFYDYIAKKDPELYNALLHESDFADDIIMKDIAYDDKVASRKIANERTEINVPKAPKKETLKLEEKIPQTYQKEIPFEHKKGTFFSMTNNRLADANTLKESNAMFNSMSQKLANKKITSKDKAAIVKTLNETLYGGQDIISINATRRDLGQFIDNVATASQNKLNGIPDILNQQLNKIKMYAPSLTDPYYDAKIQKRSEIFKVKKQDIDNKVKELNNIAKSGKITDAQRTELFEAKSMQKQLEDWWSEHKDLNPNQWSEKFPSKDKALDGYYEAVEELADKSKNNIKPKSKDYYGIDDVSNKEMNTLYDSYKQGSLKLDDLNEKEQSIIEYMSNKEEALCRASLDSKSVERNTGYSNDKTYFDKLKESRKHYGLEYVNSKSKITIPTGKQNYKTLMSHKGSKEAINNIKKVMQNEFKIKFSNNNKETLETLRDLKMENLRYLREMGVDDKAYFNELKNISQQMMEYEMKNSKPVVKYKSKDMKDIHNAKLNKPKKSTPVEELHINIKGRKPKTNEMSADDLQYQYLKLQGAKTIDELFEALDGTIAQRGDDIGKSINKTEQSVTPLSSVFGDELINKNMKPKFDFEMKPNKAETVEEKLARIYSESSPLDGIDKPVDTPKTQNNLKENRLRAEYMDAVQKGKIPQSTKFEDFKPNKAKKNPILSLYDNLTREFKAGVTTNNPGWHMMNKAQNKLNSSYGIGGDVFNKRQNKLARMVGDSVEGQKEWLGMKGKIPKTDEELSKIMINDKYSLKDVKDIVEMEGLADNTFAEDLGKPESKIGQYLLPSGDKSIWGGLGLNKLDRTESYDKIHHVISKLEGGSDMSDAVASAQKTLFDYDDISKVEKDVAKRIMPFYTYYRKNLPLQLDQFANSPRAMSTYMDAKNQFEKGIDDEDKQRRDEWTANRLQIPNTTMQEKGKDNTMYNMMLNPSTPWDALTQLPTPNSEGINNLPSLNPMLETVYRAMTGEDMFGNSYEAQDKNILDIFAEQYIKPTMGAVGKLDDVKKATSKQNEQLKLLELLTGVKAKYYKSYQDWGFEKDDNYKPSDIKKELVKKYK